MAWLCLHRPKGNDKLPPSNARSRMRSQRLLFERPSRTAAGSKVLHVVFSRENSLLSVARAQACFHLKTGKRVHCREPTKPRVPSPCHPPPIAFLSKPSSTLSYRQPRNVFVCRLVITLGRANHCLLHKLIPSTNTCRLTVHVSRQHLRTSTR